jgi:hypothetical protein
MHPAAMLIRVSIFRRAHDEAVRGKRGYTRVHHVKLNDLYL